MIAMRDQTTKEAMEVERSEDEVYICEQTLEVKLTEHGDGL